MSFQFEYCAGKFKHSAKIGKGYRLRTLQKYLLYTSYKGEGVGVGEGVGEDVMYFRAISI